VICDNKSAFRCRPNKHNLDIPTHAPTYGVSHFWCSTARQQSLKVPADTGCLCDRDRRSGTR